MSDVTTTLLPSQDAIKRIARAVEGKWDRSYVRIKLRSDPVYGAVVNELRGIDLPVLDIGCGMGLLSCYLRLSGMQMPIVGFDYDDRKIASAKKLAIKANHQDVSFSAGDARHEMPEFSGHVIILDILQFFTKDEQDKLLTEAAARIPQGGKLIIRSGLQDDSWRFKVTVLGDYFAKATFWMKAAPTCYPSAEQMRSVLGSAGLSVRLQPLWGGTPFNNYLIVAER